MESVNKLNGKAILKWIISIGIALSMYIIPLGELCTISTRHFMASTVLCILVLAFELMNEFAIGMLMITLWILSGIVGPSEAMSGWASTTYALLVGVFVLANTLDRINLLKRIGYSLILKTGGTFSGAMWGLFFACIALSGLTFTVGFALPLTLAYTLYKALDLKPTDRESIVIVVTLLVGAVQSKSFLYGPISISMIEMGVRSVVPEFTLPWYEILFHNFICIIFCLGFEWVTLKWYKRGAEKNAINVSEVSNSINTFREKYNELGKISNTEKKGAAILIFIVIYMLTQPFHKLEMNLAFMFAVVLAFMPGINIAEHSDITKVRWGSLMLVTAFLSIGTVAAKSGFIQLLNAYLVPIIQSCGLNGGIVATVAFGAVANLFLTPAAMCMMLSGSVAQFCMDLGLNMYPYLYAIYLASDLVFLPYEYMPYLLTYAFGMLGFDKMVKVCTIKTVAFFIFICIVVIPLWNVLGIVGYV